MTTLTEIPLDQITPHPKNVRRDDTPDDELIASIEAQGILQPLGVVPNTNGTTTRGYLLVAGHRRFLAAKKAGLDTAPALILDHLTTEAQQIEAMLVENGRRVDLTAVEEGAAYEQLTILGVSEAEIATKTGRSAKTVKQRLALVQLPDTAREALHGHQITLGQAEQLLELESHPELLDNTLEQMGTDNFEFVVRRSVQQAQRLTTEAELRDEYSAMGLPEIKRPKSGWDYQTGPRPARDGETPDAWYAGGNDHWDTAPALIVSKLATAKKTADQLKADEEWKKREAKAKKEQEAAELARRMRYEHVAELARGMKIPAAVMPHLRAGVARIVAGMTASEIEELIAVSGAELERAKNDYHNDQLASQVLTLSNEKLLTVFGTALAMQATTHLFLGYGGSADETALSNATAYWDAFEASKYELPKIDKAQRTELTKKLAKAVAADAGKAKA